MRILKTIRKSKLPVTTGTLKMVLIHSFSRYSDSHEEITSSQAVELLKTVLFDIAAFSEIADTKNSIIGVSFYIVISQTLK